MGTRDIVESFAKAMTGDPAAFDTLCTPDIEFTDGGPTLKGIEQVKQYAQGWSTAFPDARMELKRVVDGGSEAAAEIVYEGTHTGPLAGPQGEIPPTGKHVSVPGAAFITLSGDRIKTFHGYYDGMAFLQQLGLMEPAAAAAR